MSDDKNLAGPKSGDKADDKAGKSEPEETGTKQTADKAPKAKTEKAEPAKDKGASPRPAATLSSETVGTSTKSKGSQASKKATAGDGSDKGQAAAAAAPKDSKAKASASKSGESKPAAVKPTSAPPSQAAAKQPANPLAPEQSSGSGWLTGPLLAWCVAAVLAVVAFIGFPMMSGEYEQDLEALEAENRTLTKNLGDLEESLKSERQAIADYPTALAAWRPHKANSRARRPTAIA